MYFFGKEYYIDILCHVQVPGTLNNHFLHGSLVKHLFFIDLESSN